MINIERKEEIEFLITLATERLKIIGSSINSASDSDIRIAIDDVKTPLNVLRELFDKN